VHCLRTTGLVPLLIVCATTSVARRGPADSSSTSTIRSGRELLTFERTACFGTCPAYKLVLFEDRRVRYEGSLYVKDRGPVEARIAPSAMAKVQSNLQRASTLPSDCCNCYGMTDMPAVTMTFRVTGGGTNRIDHYRSCEKTPDWLYDVENSIDAALQTERWVGRAANYKPFHLP
jgi:Domain of unknown function (DUF6438)